MVSAQLLQFVIAKKLHGVAVLLTFSGSAQPAWRCLRIPHTSNKTMIRSCCGCWRAHTVSGTRARPHSKHAAALAPESTHLARPACPCALRGTLLG